MGAWLSSALITAQELASNRGQTVSTAHLLVALVLSEREIEALCARQGLDAASLVAELVFVDERRNSVELAVERARKLATAMGMPHVVALHLLHALAHQPGSSSNRVLFRIGVSPERLSQAALDALEEAPPQLQPSAADVSRASAGRASQQSPKLSDEARRESARTNGLWLGDEVEARLQRRQSSQPADAPATFADRVEAKLRHRR